GWYYGGLYPGLAFLAYAPLRALGFSAFPIAPIVLRSLSAIGGLLALMITYNFGRYHAGRIAATIAALVVLTDAYFVHYSVIIHPDSFQFALGMLALTIAVQHLREGDLESLAALGLISGLVQGTKMGGPWLVPLAVLAATVGLGRQSPALSFKDFGTRLCNRGIVLVAFAVLAYIVSTPYAFLKRDFIYQSIVLIKNIMAGRITHITYLNWLSDLWGHFGPVLLIAAMTGAALVCVRALFGNFRWPM